MNKVLGGRAALLSASAKGHDEGATVGVDERWNATDHSYSSETLIWELFEGAVRRHPDAVAVRDEAREHSYAELDEASNRLARYLGRLGVGTDTLVAVCMDRSVELMVALLGVLKAGGAYVPLDPTYPAERLRYMLSDSRPRVVLTHSAVPPTVRDELSRNAHPGLTILDLTSDDAAWRQESAQGVERGAQSPTQLAYVIYTSGSTGRPKGVMVEHRSVVNRLEWMQSEYGLTPDDVVLQKTPIGFDVSVWELFWPLLSGARLIMARPNGHKDPEYLCRVVAQEGVTTIHFVPSMLTLLLECEAVSLCAGLVRVFASGEALPASTACKFLQRLPSARLYNLYGPTEATVDVTAWACPSVFQRDDIVPIGKPIWNTRIYILDDMLQPAGVGVEGELYIGGVGLARGYLNREELTAERFVSHRMNGEVQRLYRTGDVARYAQDGNIEFLGRNDAQVKVRGFRIELAEIEATIEEHAQVKGAVVEAREETDGERRLIAYVALGKPDEPTERTALLKGWQELYDQTYASEGVQLEDDRFSGWKSSYTQRPFGRDEMQDWLDGVLVRVRALQPKNVLELGCGTGLILQGLLSSCESYSASDISLVALEELGRKLGCAAAIPPKVHLVHADALGAFPRLPARSFDTIILNSVVQYFPSVEYLREVLVSAVSRVQPGGHVFLGDIRRYDLRGAFYASALLARESDDRSLHELRAAVEERIQDELELLIDPLWFLALEGSLSGISSVEIVPKASRYGNEMSAFRYDVILTVNGEASPAPELDVSWLDGADLDLAKLEQLLGEADADVLHLASIRNPLTDRSARLFEALQTTSDAGLVADLRARIPEGPGVTCAELCAAGERTGYDVCLSWAAGGTRGEYHAVLTKRAGQSSVLLQRPLAAPERAEVANHPLRARLRRSLPADLRAHVERLLPDYMVPAGFVILDEFPLTPNGKLDRAALPRHVNATVARGRYEAPQGDVETRLAELWETTLNVARVSRHDRFIELGGHSLLAVALLDRMRRVGLKIDLESFFGADTLADVARAVRLGGEADEAARNPDAWPKLDAEQRATVHAVVPGGQDNVAAAYPLSSLQQGFLFHHLVNSVEDPYAISLLLRLDGVEAVRAYLRAVQRVVERHDALRTSIVWDGLAEPLQVVLRSAAVEVVEASVEPGADVGEQLRRACQRGGPVLDLSRGPLTRIAVAKEPGSERWLLLHVIHHIVCDHASFERILEEVRALMLAPDAELPPPVSLAEALSANIGEASSEQHRDFFRRMLGDLREPTAPFGFGEPYAARREVVETRREVPGALTIRVARVANRLGASVAAVYHVAWALVLARASRQQDVVFGTVLFGKMSHRADSGAVGLFVNTLPIRVRTTGMPAGVALRAAQRQLTRLLGHSRASLAEAQSCSELPPGSTPFHALLNYYHHLSDIPEPPLMGAGRAVAAWPAVELLGLRERTSYPLVLNVGAGSLTTELHAQCLSSSDPERICDMMLTSLHGLVSALEENEDVPLTRIDVLPADERTRLVCEWNATAHPYSSEALLWEQIEAAAEAHANQIAVSDDERQLSYSELDRAANRLARHLRGLGVGPDTLVAVCMERSVELVVALLGVLKAGGAYVPLDPTYPLERLRFMLGDSHPRVIVSHGAVSQSVRDQLSEYARCGVPVLDLSLEQGAWIRESDSSVSREAQASTQLAYVIYTSGSTGHPKGVMVEHRSLVNRLEWMQEEYGLTPQDVVLQKTPIGFDVSVWELFWPLLQGARLVMARPNGHKDPEYLCRLVTAEGVTTIHFVPSMLASFLEARSARDCNGVLIRVIASGEALSSSLGNRFCEVLPDVVLHNLYGPTEATVDVTSWQVKPGEGGATVPIGRPIWNTQLYLLDQDMQPVPVGVHGELYIGGVGVARGYLHRDELTRERFVSNPFVSSGGGRLYRTGDIGRYREGGVIEFLGRNDHQVKLRGFRVELGEIEAKLSEHPEVREAVVIATDAMPEERRLVAYCVTTGEVRGEQLRTFLGAHLPEYMVPTSYVPLRELPLTPNGKLDRSALPQAITPESGRGELPQGDVEMRVASLWRDLLGVAQPRQDDRFLELGGHSLLAIKLLSRIRLEFGVDLQLEDLFAHPTLSGLSARIAESASAGAAEQIDERTSAEPSFAQQRLWFLSQLGGEAAYNMPFAVRLSGSLDPSALQRALDSLMERHEVLRSSFSRLEGQCRRHVSDRSSFALDERLDEVVSTERLEEIKRAEALATFDLQRGPVCRGKLLRTGAQEYVLLLTFHHIVSDGWSMGLVARELQVLYREYTTGAPSSLPPVAVSYGQYVAWQQRWLASEGCRSQLEYWREALTGAPTLLSLPLDRPRPLAQDYAGARIEIGLEPGLVSDLRALARERGATLFMTVLTGFAVVLARLSGQSDLVVGVPVANRGRPELEAVVGMFVNTLAVRLDLSGDLTLAAALERVVASTLAAQRNQEVPFEQVVEAVRPPRSLAHSPIFQVMFAWQTGEDWLPELAGVACSAEPIDYSVSKFDLTLDLKEREGRVVGALEYATSLFEADTVQRYAGYLETVLRAMAAEPAQLAAEIDLLGQVERKTLLEVWNPPPVPLSDVCVHELFEAMVSKHGQLAAVAIGTRELSYDALNSAANRLARELGALGVREGDRVAICLERSFDSVIAILATLKAGGAYVPLDPAYPAERLRYMLVDSGARLVLTHARVSPELQASLATCAPLLGVDEARSERSDSIEGKLEPTHVSPASLAYVIYTSGSTGKPKGVMIEHRGWRNLAAAQAACWEVKPGDRIFQFASLSFDASAFELAMALCHGAVLCLPQAKTALAGEVLLQELTASRATHVTLPPVVLSTIPATATLENVRTIIVAGETPAEVVVERWAADGRLLNAYGPTEATVWATWANLEHCDPARPHIGKPIPNARVYILDERGGLVPTGVAGELCIGGVGVARGYANQPELTSARFVADPFDRSVGSRVYRTGDLARYRNDGNIEFLGRRDFQIKLRGFRIELSEIEARLAEHPHIREAVVVARGVAPSDKRLLAYYVAREPENGPMSPELLKQHLAKTLPEHMVPAAYVWLAELPLTRNGKLDRDSLPEPHASAYSLQAYVAPSGAMESRIAELWCRLLGREQVGRADNFFELGGHSLLAVTLLEDMAALGLRADVRTLFSTRTLAEFAAEVGRADLVAVSAARILAGTSRIAPEMVPLVNLSQDQLDRLVAEIPGGAGNVQDIYPLGPLQEGILFHHLMVEDSDTYLVSFVRAFSERQSLEAYLAALRVVIERHDILRTAIKWRGLPEPVQVVLRQAPLVVEELRLRPEDGDVAAQLVQRCGRRSHKLDLGEAPLLRWFVAEDAPNHRWVALELIHHMIGDHTTGDVAEREVRAIMRGDVADLPAPVPFREAIASAIRDRQEAEHEAFFTELLGDVEEPTAPFGLVNARGDGSAVRESTLRLPTLTALRLRAVARSLGVTPASLFHVAWGCVLARVSGGDDVTFGTVLFGRTQGARGSSRAMGMFINTLPVRLQIGSTGVHDSVRAMHDLLARLLRHEYASLALAQRCSAVPAPTPLLTSLLNYRHSEASQAASLSHDGVELLATEDRTNFPLALSVDDLGREFELTTQGVAPIDPERVCAMVQVALESLVEYLEFVPHMAVANVEVLPESEAQALTADFNATRVVAVDGARCLHQLFEERAKLSPDAVAVVDGSRSLSFADLEHRANEVARRLPPGVRGGRVALCLVRSVELVVVIYAILKRGGTYVPLESGLPLPRLLAVLADCQPELLIVADEDREKFAESGVTILSVPQLLRAQPTQAELSDRDLSPVGPEAAAYMIYTSGSTGTPKGVLVSHAAIVNHTRWMRRQFPLEAGDRVLQKTSVGFDASVWEFHAPLAEGATLVIALHGVERDPALLAKTVQEHAITILQVVPSMLAVLIDEPALRQCTTLRRVFCGGEALDASTVRAFRAVLPGPQLINLYGPTEATIDATFSVVGDVSGGVSLGRPIDNAQVYVLDSRLRPSPVGVTGQLCVGGACLADGYWNRPELTAEKFVRHPSGSGRLYLTGDLARFSAVDRLEFVGRSDGQVKLRGHRLELGEVESQLMRHPLVRQASAMVREDRPRDRRLVAYVVPDWEATDSQTHVNEWAQIHDTVLDESLGADSEFAGWNSAYTREAIPEVEMRDWLDNVLARIRALHPTTVLEIGCGTGMILRRLAPSCQRYVGTDFSSHALRRLAQRLESNDAFAATNLHRAEARDFSAVPSEAYDTVVINSVVQYFPSLDYLLDVVQGAMDQIPSNGRIFIGDVRNARLLPAFHLSVLRQAAPQTPLSELLSAAAQRAAADQELAIDPAWFVALSGHCQRVSHVEVMPRECEFTNELSSYRYDVVIHVGDAPRTASDVRWLDYRTLRPGYGELARSLRECAEPVVAVAFIANSRVSVSAALARGGQDEGASGSLTARVDAAVHAGLTCREVCDLCRGLGYKVVPSWSCSGDRGEFNVLVIKDGADVVFDWRLRDERARGTARGMANEPLRAKLRSALPELLRAQVSAMLPEYMVPAAIVVLDSWPRTPSGKIDRRALPAPEARVLGPREYEAPANELEACLARLWEEVLGVEGVGRSEQFFELGGHSLLAVSLIARLRHELQVDVPLRELFASPRLRDFAAVVARASSSGRDAVVKRTTSAPALASFPQQRLWFIAQLEGAGAAYHIPLAFRLQGQLDVGALRSALSSLVARHDSLRTTFAQEEGAIVQRLSPASEMAFEEVALVDAGRHELGEVIRSFVSAPFDLQAGPLLRARLLVLAEHEHLLLLVAHHIVTDGWSTGIMLRELGVAYEALHAERENPLPAPHLQYADYSDWQRDWLGSGSAREQAAYWQRQLAGAPSLTELPWDRARPAQQSFRGHRLDIRVGAETTIALKELSRRHGMTLFMTVLAAFAAVLSRLSNQNEVVIGTPVANRTRAEFEELVGLFVNTLALRIDLSGKPTVEELLERVRTVTVDAQGHQELPFEKVVEMLRPARSLAYSPVFQVMFVWQSVKEQPLLLSDLVIQAEPISYDISKFDLTLSLSEREGEIVGSFEYATALFDSTTIELFLRYFVRTLKAMVADPQQLVARIPWKDEREPSMEPAGRALVTGRRGACMHELFESQVARWPTAVALAYGGASVSYAELNQRANRLAHRLRRLGVVPDDRVAICAERNVQLIVGLLAILKAGAGYVPIDPEYPQERFAYVVLDAKPRALLTFLSAANEERLTPSAQHLPVVDLRDEHAWDDEPSSNLARHGLRDSHLAYVIYTSGSTGRPKGVMVEHRNVSRLFFETERLFRFGPADVWCLFHSSAFDFSVWEIWGALAYGGRLVVVPFSVSRTPDEFHSLVCAEGVTVLNQTPSAFRGFMAASAASSRSHGLRYVILGGEALDPSMLGPWWSDARNVDAAVVNMYGITETTVHVTFCPVTAADKGASTSPIGQPIDDLAVYVLDELGQPVPPGVKGELYVGGPGVARGYLNRPELTEERFLPDPFAGAAGARMYRTGDVGRVTRDGTLEFAGRNDGQVKLRGFRIELGEIESKLAMDPAVRDALVILREDTPGDARLVAYCTARDNGQRLEPEVLRAGLARWLPEYMVPAAYVQIEALPLTVNGKLDQRALPAPGHEAFGKAGGEAPVGPIERALAAIWGELLRLGTVGRHDNFFELGGHSLLATSLVARVQQRLGVTARLKDVFAWPVLSDFALAVAKAAPRVLPAFALTSDEHAPPLSFAQQRLWFLSRMDSVGSAYHIPLALRLRGRLDVATLRAALDRIVSRHESLRTTFVLDGLQPVQSIQREGIGFSLEVLDLSSPELQARIETYKQDAVQAAFDLATGPLARGRVLSLAADLHVLILTVHHIVADGWSMDLLVRELSELYTASFEQREAALPYLPVSYANYASSERAWLGSAETAAQAEYWLTTMRATPVCLALPTDRPRPPEQDYRGDRVDLRLDPRLTGRLRALAQRQGTTLFTTVLTGFFALLARLTGQDDIVVGVPVANRSRPELENLIGLFVNTVAVRVALGRDDSFLDLLRRTDVAAVSAQENQELPFERVVELVNPERSLAYPPIFQVMMSWRSAAPCPLDLPGITACVEHLGYPVAKFDLVLDLFESGADVRGGIDYATALFERETVERFAGYLVRLLSALSDDPSQLVDEADMLSPPECQLLLHDWNATAVELSHEPLIHRLIEAHGASHPEGVALRMGGKEMSYGELCSQANRMAHYLSHLGVGVEDRVAICLPRSFALVVAMLAVLKAGAAYVPLDPEYPRERLDYMLRDSEPKAIVCDMRVQANAGQSLGTESLWLPVDVDEPAWSAFSDQPFQAEGQAPSSSAYVIYTSGSTGQPKGVVVEHRNLSNYVHWARGAYDYSCGAIVTSSICFDATITSTLVPLVCGATAELIRDGDELFGLAELLSRRPAGLLKVTPAHLHAIGQEIERSERVCAVGTLVVGGEALPGSTVARWRRIAPGARIINEYGPTETVVGCAVHDVGRADIGSSVPIGRPIANTRIYLLDRRQQPVPRGVVGEIYIGGAGVARGYLNREQLTKERFLPDPFVGRAGARMYRTGDLGRHSSNGTLEFLGRNDLQVKLRGYRIELGEIEHCLQRHPSVDSAVVVARTDSVGEARLVAYCTPVPEEQPRVTELREHLVALLPGYMLPSSIVVLDQLPLTANGKVDRRALPTPQSDDLAVREYIEPVGPIETKLARLWAEVLGVERVGSRDRFFELGGHSLLAVSLLERMRQEGLRADVRGLFKASDLAALARLTEEVVEVEL